jgi:hypothetical protein
LTGTSSLSPSSLSYRKNGGAIQTVTGLSFVDNFVTNFVNITPGDGSIGFGNVSVSLGDTFTIVSATYTNTAGVVPNFNPLANQTFTGNVFLADINGIRRSGNVALVPEPSSALLGLCGLTLLALRRRTR